MKKYEYTEKQDKIIDLKTLGKMVGNLYPPEIFEKTFDRIRVW